MLVKNQGASDIAEAKAPRPAGGWAIPPTTKVAGIPPRPVEYAINFLHADEHDGELLAEDTLGTLTVREVRSGRLRLGGSRLSQPVEVSSQQAFRAALLEFPDEIRLGEEVWSARPAQLLTPFGRAEVYVDSFPNDHRNGQAGWRYSAALNIKDTELAGVRYAELFIRFYPHAAPHILLRRGASEPSVSGLDIPQSLRRSVHEQQPHWITALLTPENIRCASLRYARKQLREEQVHVTRCQQRLQAWEALKPPITAVRSG